MSVSKGDTVTYRGALCRVVEVYVAPTPAGGEVKMVKLERPRAGLKWVLEVEVERPEVRAEPDRTRFRS